jgi:hypothetical protein
MLWVPSRPVRSRSKPPGFILPCQPALAQRPPSGPGWLHEVKRGSRFSEMMVDAIKSRKKLAGGFCCYPT